MTVEYAPLAGVRVLDFSTLLPGPVATLMRADAGPDVIKIKRSGAEAAAAGMTDTEVVRRVTGDGFDVAALPSPMAAALLDDFPHALSPVLIPLPDEVDRLWTSDPAPTGHLGASQEAS